MDYMKKRWLVLFASCFINLCIGSMYSWSVFSAPMATYLSHINNVKLTPADLSVVFVVANSIGPITMISGGKITDTLGPRLVILLGGIMFGGGMFLCGFATKLIHLILAYGILTGLGLGMVYGATINNSIKFFPDKRGMVGGLTTALFGISSVIIPPVATMITQTLGVISAFKIIGAAFTLIVCGCAFLVDKCPEHFIPAGWAPSEQQKTSLTSNKNWQQMLRTPVFYVLLTLLTCGAVAGLMCIALVAPLAQKMIGMSTAAATLAVSILALFNVLGRIFAGIISDKIGRINTLSLACVFSVLGSGIMYGAGIGDINRFYLSISIIGLCFGAFMGVFPGFTADQFGTKNNSVNFGIMFSGFAIAGYVGPMIMVTILNATGHYQPAFLVAIGFSIVGLVLSCVYRFINKIPQRSVGV